MPSPFGPLRLVVDPGAGGGAVGRWMPDLTAALRSRGLDFDVVEAAGPGRAEAAAADALADGLRFVVAAGGDRTVHELVNAMVPGGRPLRPDAVLGVASTGAGCDFARTFGLDRPPDILARHLASDAVMDIDLGHVACSGVDGRPVRRLFANVAEVGYGAEVIRRANRLRRLGRLGDLLAAYAAMATLRRPEATVKLATVERTVPLVEVLVANCQFAGDGMKVAPRALPDDGRFNVQVVTGGRSQVFILTTQRYRGEHLPHPNIYEQQSPTVELAPSVALAVAADGRLLGVTPATFTVVPRVLQLKI
ncbi:MAG TPA: diacylglycerol kinase family protein [Egibacteraceae bacterium]|nr:diacylglycerol kinase family protein [Egibacteraceae bacterium]